MWIELQKRGGEVKKSTTVKTEHWLKVFGLIHLRYRVTEEKKDK